MRKEFFIILEGSPLTLSRKSPFATGALLATLLGILSLIDTSNLPAPPPSSMPHQTSGDITASVPSQLLLAHQRIIFLSMQKSQISYFSLNIRLFSKARQAMTLH